MKERGSCQKWASICLSGYINNYLIAKSNTLNNLFSSNMEENFSLNLDSFLRLNDSAYQEINKLFRDFIPYKVEVNRPFVRYEEWDIFSQLAMMKLKFPEYHFYFTKKKVVLPGNYFDFTTLVSTANNYALLSENYTELLSMIIDSEVRKVAMDTTLSIKEQQELSLNQKYTLAKTFSRNNDINEFLMTQVLFSYLNLGFEENFQEKLNEAESIFINRKYLQFASDRFELLKKIGKGNDSPNFNFIDLDNKKKFLSEFEGHHVFINVWSLGCHSSVKEFPYLRQIQEQFRDEKFIFLNINNGDDTKNLSEYINTNLGGINGSAGGWNSEFNKLYFVKYIPRYILIDKEGKIVDPFAPRPSSTQLLPLLKSLVKEK